MDLNERLTHGKKKKKRIKSQKGKQRKKTEEKARREREREKIFLLLSKIYGNQTVGFVGGKGKVGPCIKSYAWVPKSWSFVKLHKVENFPTWVISSLNVI